MDPVFPVLLRILGVLLWSSAVVHKLRSFAEFRALLIQYHIPFPRLHGVLAVILIAAELLLALSLCFSHLFTFGCWGSASLLGLYSVVLVREILAGRTDHACGCAGGYSAQGSIGWSLVWRNLILAALFLGATVTASERAWTWLDSFTVIAAALALVVLFVVLDTIVQSPSRGGAGKAKSA